ncbi:MAG: response regulator transcription factor [Actinomycetota bacterium]|nr:response regulator transcription factor [Actinomycetota bacterium]
MAEPKAEGAGRERSFDVVTAWLTSPSVRRALAWLAGVGTVSAWSLAVMGISMTLADSDVEEWWILPLFGTAVLILALVAVYLLRPRAAPSSRAPFDDLRPPEHSRTLEPPQPPRQRRLPVASETLIEPLSDRELEILELVATGRSNREIATELYVATGTVKAHINHIFRKVSVRNRTEAVARARELHLLGDRSA